MFLFCYFSGRICFCLVNLEPIPYAVELQEVPKSEMLAAITEMITKGVIPKQNQIYRKKLGSFTSSWEGINKDRSE